ncbi:MAG: DUF2851 family protein [Cytophagales bacterium]|nr:DUF2851 family protein [Cytophagales bacterium]
MEISESLLQFIWKNLLFKQSDLLSFHGDRICVVSPGEVNDNAGPDFSNAHIIINDIDLFGNVELHVKSSDWDVHNHSINALYDNVILHVVWYNDKKSCFNKGVEIPVLVMKDYVDDDIAKYIDLIVEKSSDVFCQRFFFLNVNFKKLLHRRIISKIDSINNIFLSNKNDFNTTIFQFLMYNFGFKVNNGHMLSLAQSIPFSVVQKVCHEYDSLFSLFLGQASLFDRLTDDNVEFLRETYAFLKTKYSLNSCRINWRFSRTRPGNFPIKRLRQVVSFFYNNDFLYDWVMWSDVDSFRQKLSTIEPSLSKASIDSLVINVFLPLTAFYNNLHKIPFLESFSKALGLIAPENNKIVRKFCSLCPLNAFVTQALVELFNNYCSHSRCLTCPVRFSKK